MARLQGSRSFKPEPPATDGREPRPFLEIQYHPGDIRRRVRYLFLTRRQVTGWTLAAVAWSTWVVFGLAITPTVIGNQLARRSFEAHQQERTRLGEELKGYVEELDRLRESTELQRLEIANIHLAYGLIQEGRGEGGYPAPPLPAAQPVPSIYATELDRGSELRRTIDQEMAALRVLLDEVRAFEAANDHQVRTTPSISPLKSGDTTVVLTSPFGSRRNPFTKQIDFHAGLDLAATLGTPIYAPADGVVTYAGRFPLRQSVAWYHYGNLVALKNGERFMTLFGHCEELKVRIGERVKQGQIIATVGNTGWSTNPHLHYEVRLRDEDGEWHPIDPLIYMLDYDWSDEDRRLLQARRAPSTQDYEPLPRAIGR